MVPLCNGRSLMGTLNVVFWDVDGTLADTEMDGHRPAFNRAFADLGLPLHWDRAEYAQRLEIPGGLRRVKRACEEMDFSLSQDQLEKIRERKRLHYSAEIAAGGVGWRPGVKRLLKSLSDGGIQNWIVTSSGRASVNALLAVSPEVQTTFSGIITADDVQHGKPSPDLYRLAMSRASVDADDALAIEDSLAGLDSALGAGLPCLITPSPWEKELSTRLNDAVAVVNHLGEPEQACRLIAGPTCAEGLVTVKYLQALLRGANDRCRHGNAPD